jgi:general secretion pathway protein G
MGRNMRTGKKQERMNGFSLLELMVVMAIIMILLGMAAVHYQRPQLNAKETVLRVDLRAMREAIEHYTMDKLAAPQSLDDLVGTYLREIPVDPISNRKDWKTETSDMLLSPDQTTTGISDVHSGSDGISPNTNTPYSSW